MPSTNKTSNLKLNQWVGTDKPMRDDFNNDNKKIDDWAGNNFQSGNWIPKLTGATIEGNITCPEASGSYYRVGKLIHYQFFLRGQFSYATKPTGGVVLTGFPFIIQTTGNKGIPGFAPTRVAGFNLGSGVGLTANLNTGQRASFNFTDNGFTRQINVVWDNHLSTDGSIELAGSGTYTTN